MDVMNKETIISMLLSIIRVEIAYFVFVSSDRNLEHVRESMHSAISMSKTEVLDSVLNDFADGYFSLSHENHRKLLLVLAKEYDLNRTQVRELIKQYLGLQLPTSENAPSGGIEEDGILTSFYRIERNLKFLSILRSDILSIIA
ncbi:hypothetical protein CsatB_000953 [Cannabis sativa]